MDFDRLSTTHSDPTRSVDREVFRNSVYTVGTDVVMNLMVASIVGDYCPRPVKSNPVSRVRFPNLTLSSQ